MNKIYLFAIASILATASLVAATFTAAQPSFAQTPPPPVGDTGSSNMTGAGNATYGGGNATAEANTGNSTASM